MLDAIQTDLPFWALAVAASIFAVMKGMERFGWLRTPTAWKTECEALQRECDRLNIRIIVLEKDLSDLRALNADLKAKPDVSALYSLMEAHDRREEENHKGTIAALDAITRRLENSGGAT